MQYAKARPNIRTGDLLAWCGGDWKSLKGIQTLAIRVFDGTPYTHVGVAWVVAGRVFVIHAVGRGVSIEPLSQQASFYWLPMNLDVSDDALEQAFSRVGEQYSRWQAILGFFRQLKIGEDALWQCAEFVLWWYCVIGSKLDADATPSAVVHSALVNGRFLWWVEND